MAAKKEMPRDTASETDVEKASSLTDAVMEPSQIENEEEEEYPTGKRLIVIMSSIYCAMFIVALDRTILGTAIPKITDEFHSIDDVGWYASSYLITASAFQLMYGRIFTFYSTKWVLLCAMGLFEIGSVVCGTAPNSIAFIVGRAIAGLGAAGIFSGCINVMVMSIPLHKRPLYQGFFGIVFGVSSVAGPIVGGAFTTNVSWRWCFYINLPIGGLVAALIFLLLQNKPSKNKDTLRQKIMQLDPLGTSVFLPGIICVLLALQWGGSTYPWNNWRIILLFILGITLLIVFLVIQFKSGDNATVPVRIIKQRSVLSGAFFQFVCPGAMMVIIYFLPIWFQAIKGVSAVRSGIDTIPMVMALVVASIIAGVITNKSGYYTGQLIACSVIMSIGAGLLTTLKADSSQAKWVGYQFIFGFGLGLGMQQAGMAAQTCLQKKDVITGVSFMFFMQGLGGSIFICIAQTVFNQSIISKISKLANLSTDIIVKTGATELRSVVPPEMLGEFLVAYNAALSDVFKVALACACATIISGLTMEWKSVKAGKEAADKLEAEKKKAAEEKEARVDVDTAVNSPPRSEVSKSETSHVKET